MRFGIHSGKPYYVTSGKAFPIEINDGAVTVSDKSANVECDGVYTLTEIIAKCGECVSSMPIKRKKKTAQEG